MSGSVVTSGEHLFLDKTSPHWRGSVSLIADTLLSLQTKVGANQIFIYANQPDDLMLDKSLASERFRDKHVVSGMRNWKTREDYMYLALNKSKRSELKCNVLRH